jgi:hypothetical protein
VSAIFKVTRILEADDLPAQACNLTHSTLGSALAAMVPPSYPTVNASIAPGIDCWVSIIDHVRARRFILTLCGCPDADNKHGGTVASHSIFGIIAPVDSPSSVVNIHERDNGFICFEDRPATLSLEQAKQAVSDFCNTYPGMNVATQF